MTGAGVAHAGYGLPTGAHRVFNNTSNILYAGETVDWDPTQASTDQALRVRRMTADSSASVAGVLLKDIPANGGYGDLLCHGRSYARVNSGVTAGALLVGDFVSSTTAGILKVATPGDYNICAVALTAAVETPTGSGAYYAQVSLLGPNQATLQSLQRGGGFNLKHGAWWGVGAAATFSRPIHIRVPHSIVTLEIASDTAVDGAGAATNTWTINVARVGGAGNIFTTGLDLRAGTGTNLVANTVLSIPAALMDATKIATSNTSSVYLVTMTRNGVPTTGPDLSAANLFFNLTLDTGANLPLAFGR